MKKVSLPSPPQPSFGAATFNSVSSSQKPNAKSSSASKTIAPLDAAFLGRVARTTIWFGTFLTFCVAIVSRDFAIAASFGAGALLGLALLKSQQMLVARLSKSKEVTEENGWLVRAPLMFLLPAKYLLISIGIFFGLKSGFLVPPAFATGFTVLQIVVFSKVIGRLLLHNQKPLREYVSNEK